MAWDLLRQYMESRLCGPMLSMHPFAVESGYYSCQRNSFHFSDSENVFISTARHIANNGLIRTHGRSQRLGIGQSMRCLKRRNDSLDLRYLMKRSQGLIISGAHVVGTTNIFEVGMLRTDAWIIKTGRHRMRVCDLT